MLHLKARKPFPQQPSNHVALLNQQRVIEQQAQQERLRELQAQQQRILENQAQQQRILAQNALQHPFYNSQSAIDQRIRMEQQAQQESQRQQAFLDAVAEQERKSYLQKKQLEQKRRRRFPDGLNDRQRLRNQMLINEQQQRELALRQILPNDQQSSFQNQQLQSQPLSGAASQQLNWIYQPQALEGGVVQQQLLEQDKRPFQITPKTPFRKQPRPQSLKRIPKQRKQRPRLGTSNFVLGEQSSGKVGKVEVSSSSDVVVLR
uniref:Uncharacterized protein n=1 Tax=Anopheles culicifacies TaxID=139723 RepID=A0A182ML82_9DIPT